MSIDKKDVFCRYGRTPIESAFVLLKHVSIFVHDSTWASVFCIDMLLKKSLVSSTISPILFCYVYEFLCSAGICGVVK